MTRLLMPRSSALAASAVLALTSLLAATLPTTSAVAASAGVAERPTPGAPGLGDRLFPLLGNGGYDALHYDLDLRYATTAPAQGIDGTVRMTAQSTQALSRFDLDFSGHSVGGVTVDGMVAQFARHGGELVITPARPIADGATFVVAVSHFRSYPTVANENVNSSVVFFRTAEGSATAGQPNAMNFVFPCNDHPSDKATFSFRFNVPAGETAVANGVLTGRHTAGSREIWTYEERQPMATELTQLVVGKYSVIDRGTVDGVLVRDVVPTSERAKWTRLLAVEKSQLRWMIAKVGRYPFPEYGSLVVTADLGFALETQTLSLFDAPLWNYPRGRWAPLMLHELSHQWFGDNVSPAQWSDVWLNEGHATWYESTYAAQRGELGADSGAPGVNGAGGFRKLMKLTYTLGDQWRAAYGPVAAPTNGSIDELFNRNVYYGGALVLYALRQKIGTAAFDRLERGWAQQAGQVHSTDDFIAFASASSGQDLTHFLRSWLYGSKTPPMPGHPDWTPLPA